MNSTRQSSILPLLAACVGTLVAFTSHGSAAGNVADMFSIGQITFPGGGKRDYVSTPFVRPVEANGTGTVSAVVNSTTLTLDPDGSDYTGTTQWTGGSATVDKWYILEILNGRYIGMVFLIKTQNGNTITTDEAVLPQDGLLEGSSYAIRKDWTLTTLFGSRDRLDSLSRVVPLLPMQILSMFSFRAASHSSPITSKHRTTLGGIP